MLSLAFVLACTVAPPDAAVTDAGGADDSADVDDSVDSAEETGGDSEDSGDTDDSVGDTDDSGQVQGPRRVILFIGDGMGVHHVEGGGLYAYGAAGTLAMEGLPYQGRLRSASLTGTTDSAAGATAYSTGHKTLNDRVGQDEDGVDLVNILEDARALGLATGVVTTDTLTGATPGSFIAHVADRSDNDDIAADLFADPPHVVLGGGSGDLAPFLDTSIYNVVQTSTELAAVTDDGRPLVGVFANVTFPYVADGYTTEPALVDMVTKALTFLEDDPEGFVLVVEGARIDHASHAMDGDRVHQETAAFDAAVAAGIAWAADYPDATLLVTADHECGGLAVSGGGAAGTLPDSTFRWGQHTNADVPVYGTGALAAVIDDQRLDNVWVHAILEAAIAGESVVTPPEQVLVADGYTADLGAAVTTQVHETSFGVAFNQLDALRVTGDENGLWVGVDGVFQRDDNAVIVLLDLDYGEGTGLGGDVDELTDVDGYLDRTLSQMPWTVGLAGLGFDIAFGNEGARELAIGTTNDSVGPRGLGGVYGATDDFAWLDGIVAIDDGNIADGAEAPDAGSPGTTEGGMEIRIPWTTLFPSGLPASGLDIAVVAVLTNGNGAYASNQVLPPLSSGTEGGYGGASLESAVMLTVDGMGTLVGTPSLVP